MHQKAQNLHGEMTNTIREQIRNIDVTLIHFGIYSISYPCYQATHRQYLCHKVVPGVVALTLFQHI